MPLNFQLPVAVILAVAGLLSLAFRGLSASERGKIALPITPDGPLQSRPDPFDVTLPEDIIDGEPVDEARFWVNVSSVVRMCILSPIYYSVLDNAPGGIAHHCFCCHRIPPDCITGLFYFILAPNRYCYPSTSCLIFRLPLCPCCAVHRQKYNSFAHEKNRSPLHTHDSRFCPTRVYGSFPQRSSTHFPAS